MARSSSSRRPRISAALADNMLRTMGMLALIALASAGMALASPSSLVRVTSDDDDAGLDLEWRPAEGDASPVTVLVAVPPHRSARVVSATSGGTSVAGHAVRVLDGR